MASNVRRVVPRSASSQVRVASSYLYSTYRLPTTLAATDYPIFSGGIGSVAQGFSGSLTPTQTNLRTGGRIPDQQRFRIRQIGVQLQLDASVADVMQVLNLTTGYLWLDKPDLKYYLGPVVLFPGGSGMVTAATTYANNGFASTTARINLKNAFELNAGDTFTINFTVTGAKTLSATVDMLVILFGESQTRVVSQ